jgi:hypothetical protein
MATSSESGTVGHRGRAKVRNVEYVCERCGAALWIPAGSTPKRLTTAPSIAGEGRAHFVIRVRGKNVHRCAIDQPDQEVAARP